jgi:hypothetical protein
MILEGFGGHNKLCYTPLDGTFSCVSKVCQFWCKISLAHTAPGVRYQIPHLWQYFVLNQILPISFTQNLFCVALLLTQQESIDEKLLSSKRIVQRLTVSAYILSLLAVPRTLGSGVFFIALFCTRAILLSPYFLLEPAIPRGGKVGSGKGSKTFFSETFLAVSLAALLHGFQTWKAGPSAFKALHENSAVATLGYDYLIALASLTVFVTK